MPVVIKEIVTEVVVTGADEGASDSSRSGADRDDLADQVVRRAVERVLEILRREWEV